MKPLIKEVEKLARQYRENIINECAQVCEAHGERKLAQQIRRLKKVR